MLKYKMLTHGLHVEYVFCGTLLRLLNSTSNNNNKVSQQSYNDEINKHDDNMFMSVLRSNMQFTAWYLYNSLYHVT